MNLPATALSIALSCSCLLSSCVTFKFADQEEPEDVWVAEDKNQDWRENYKEAQEKYTGKPGWNQAPAVPKPPAALPGTSYSRVAMSQPYIAMTFDDGPHPTNTPRLLDMLKQRNIRATFFVVGPNSKNHPGILRRMVAEGHEIANHTWTHGDMTKVSQAAVRKELNDSRDAIVAATGIAPKLWRPPYGAVNSNLKNWIKQEYGYPTIMWSVDPMDWKRPGASVVADRLVSGTGNGGILLAHDIHKPTIDAMPSALDRLMAKGYKFVTVSQLIAIGTGTAAVDKKEDAAEPTIIASAIKPIELVEEEAVPAE
ncbi:MAG: peptidoglycan/xylan/chitin deacetylase (PgdA/CDA1 family) [Verrucomicrobiales bacterium]|jgi:peptidoglycan/xylan/chitin deacetylase (PgdA/CDA1 family)